MVGEWTYDVFLSFRGKDIRQHFIGHLYEGLRGRGIHTFLDDEELERGDDITRSLLTAIQHSMIAIPVFSLNYATSSFCLDELVNIMDCADQIVLPVFYEVDPFHVRHLRGTYGEALAMHEERFKSGEEGSYMVKNMQKLEKWKTALKRAANLSGYHFKIGCESEHMFIKRIAAAVSKWIHLGSLHVADHLVGRELQVREVMKLLKVGFDDEVCMVGIHGIGGIGKTTLARAIYNSIARSFEGTCFLGNVRESSGAYGLVYLQKIILHKLTGDTTIELGDVNEGISIIRHRLCQVKVLLVVDDADNVKQLRAIVRDSKWFGSGSRIIVTTRNKGLLASHGVRRTYEVGKLNGKESRELFIWNAFRTDEVDPSYEDILNRIVTFTSGLPLALELIGSNLFGKSKEEWESALQQYKRIPNKEIQQILKVSFDDLEEDEKNFFLDIACFLNGESFEYVERILHTHHGVCPKSSIRVLVDKSLVKIDGGIVRLHDFIQDMGQEIVRQESPEEPKKRSRLWSFEDIKHVLEENKGSNKTEIIDLVFPNSDENINWDGEAFVKMNNLKTLIVHTCCSLEGPKKLPNSLRVLIWQYYPSQSLPSDFYPKKLVMMDLSYSCLNSIELQEKFVNLKYLRIDGCKLKHIPDVSFAPNLEELSFRQCQSLIEVHESVGLLEKLRVLDAHGCSLLKRFPDLMLPTLEELYLSSCSSLKTFPKILGKMESLTMLELIDTQIAEFPSSIQYITRLQKLVLGFSGIVELPSSIFVLKKLKYLSIQMCDGLILCVQHEGEEEMSSMAISNQLHLDFRNCNLSDEFLQIGVPRFSNVKKLDLSINSFKVLPASIKECFFLKELILDGCCNLEEIRGIPPNIEKFSARHCRSLRELDLTLVPACTKECHLLKELILDGCKNLKEIRGIPQNITAFQVPTSTCTFVTSSYRSMLLNQGLNHSCMGSSISFWFQNKFPAICLCVIAEQSCASFSLRMIINGHNVPQFSCFFLEKDNMLIIPLSQKLKKINDEVHNLLLQNEWNHVELFNDPIMQRLGGVEPDDSLRLVLNEFKPSDAMEDIEFTNPLLKKEEDKVSLPLHPPLSLSDGAIQINDTTIVQASKDHPAKAQDAEITGCSENGQEIPLIQDDDDDNDDVEMEAFYASLNVTNVLSHSHDKFTTNAPNEEARNALKTVKDFIINNDASVLLHDEHYNVIQNSLNYLSGLTSKDGISGEVETLVSEASWLFNNCSREYVESCIKIKSTASELQRVDELEAGLESNKNRYRENVALENELRQTLDWMEKKKRSWKRKSML
ncbi:hypothetical protein PIB30_019025 [Stylosanthes scabra]|uniref:TIR domain-containing protein n=1 Tax=Stylosanthes scabra TaxID=79078 RepID=A0ABU6R8E9_9FABA|nr:hypothetical protein [Stylosanthes scabra]